MLLSRLAWSLYWIGCNIQRAEDNARVALAQKTISNRIGQDVVPLTSEFLMVLKNHPDRLSNEESCTQYLLTDRENPFSTMSALDLSYANVRSMRTILPGEVQHRITVLRKLASALSTAGKTVMQEHLEGFIRTTLAFAGLISTGMLRDSGYLFWQVGRQLAAAEITCAIVHACLRCKSEDSDDSFSDSLLWVQVLNSLGMLEAYRRLSQEPVKGTGAAMFIVGETRIGHSAASCLAKATTSAAVLPHNTEILMALSKCQARLRSYGKSQANAQQALQRLGYGIESAMAQVAKSYFPKL